MHVPLFSGIFFLYFIFCAVVVSVLCTKRYFVNKETEQERPKRACLGAYFSFHVSFHYHRSHNIASGGQALGETEQNKLWQSWERDSYIRCILTVYLCVFAVPLSQWYLWNHKNTKYQHYITAGTKKASLVTAIVDDDALDDDYDDDDDDYDDESLSLNCFEQRRLQALKSSEWRTHISKWSRNENFSLCSQK